MNRRRASVHRWRSRVPRARGDEPKVGDVLHVGITVDVRYRDGTAKVVNVHEVQPERQKEMSLGRGMDR